MACSYSSSTSLLPCWVSGVKIEEAGRENARGQHDKRGGGYPSLQVQVLLLTPLTNLKKLLSLQTAVGLPSIHHLPSTYPPSLFCPPSHLPICLTFIHHPSIHYPSIIYPIHLSVHPSIYHLPSIWPRSTMLLSIQPFTHLFCFHPPSSIHALSIQCIHLSIHPSTIHLYIHLPIQFSIHLPPTIHPSTICHPCVLAMLGAKYTERGKPAPQSRSRRRGQERGVYRTEGPVGGAY